MQWFEKTYTHEHYQCPQCAKDLARNQITDSWTCIACSAPVHIYAKDDAGRKLVLIRLNPRELREGDLIIVPTSGLEFTHLIINITREGDQYRIALREYRTVNIDSDSVLERVVGGW